MLAPTDLLIQQEQTFASQPGPPIALACSSCWGRTPDGSLVPDEEEMALGQGSRGLHTLVHFAFPNYVFGAPYFWTSNQMPRHSKTSIYLLPLVRALRPRSILQQGRRK